MNRQDLVFQMGLLGAVLAVAMAACAQLPDSSKANLSIHFKAPERSNRFSQTAYNSIDLPSSAAEFNCYVINVIGQDILSADEHQFPSTEFQDLLDGNTYCSYPGITSKFFALSAGQSKTIRLSVPKGSNRLVQVLGFTNIASCPNISFGEAVEATNNAGAAFPEVFEIGRAVTDISESTSVNVTNVYNQASPRWANCLSTIPSAPTGIFQTVGAVTTGNSPSDMNIGDFNGDGFEDLALGDSSSNVISLVQSDPANAIYFSTSRNAVRPMPIDVALGDFDNDGDLDLVYSHYVLSTNILWILLNDGSGSFAGTGSGATPYLTDMVVGDFNEDGNLDAAYVDWGTAIEWAPGDGAGGTSTPQNVTTGSSFDDLIAEDFNGDTHIDLLFTESGGYNMRLFTNDGTATFSSDSSTSLSLGSQALVAGDFDNDGDLDIAVTVPSGQEVQTYLNDGTGNFLYFGEFATSFNPREIATADVDADDTLDLAVTMDTGFSVWHGLGTGNFIQLGNDYMTSSNALSFIGFGLFNNDAAPDLAVLDGNSVQFLVNELEPVIPSNN